MKVIFCILLIIASSPIFSNGNKETGLPYADTIYSEEAPVPLNGSEVYRSIIYPEEAKEEYIEGKVIIHLLVGLDGNVEKTGEITGPKIFYDEVKRVSVNLKFSPGKVNGYPVKVWVKIPYNFKINE